MRKKLEQLKHNPGAAINRAAQTLRDLRKTWENTTQEERRDQGLIMVQEVGVEMAARVHLLQSLAVCAHCGRRLRVQTPKNYPTYYREDSHLRGYYDCPYSGQSIHADRLDEQVAALIQSLKLTPTWEEDVRKLLHDEQDRPDPESERRPKRTLS